MKCGVQNVGREYKPMELETLIQHVEKEMSKNIVGKWSIQLTKMWIKGDVTKYAIMKKLHITSRGKVDNFLLNCLVEHIKKQ